MKIQADGILARDRMLPTKNGELLSERQIFQQKVAARTKDLGGQNKRSRGERNMRPVLQAAKSNWTDNSSA